MVVSIDEPDADAGRLEELALDLRSELLGVDVDDVRRMRAGSAPAGTRGLDVETLGQLLVSAKLSGEIVGMVVRAVRGWLSRGRTDARSVKLTIGERTLELQSASSQQQERLIQAFLADLPEDAAYG